jgi:hypothetical protein
MISECRSFARQAASFVFPEAVGPKITIKLTGFSDVMILFTRILDPLPSGILMKRIIISKMNKN